MFKQPDLPHAPNDSNSDVRYLEKILKDWLHSDIRKEQLLAEKYYDGDHDILERKRMVIGAEGLPVPIENVVNNKLIDNQYRKLVDQKTNYTLGKPLTIATSNDTYLKLLNKVFDKKNHRKLRLLAQYAVDGGIAWLYPYYDENSNFKLAVFPSHEICAVWKDKAHTELDCALRYYPEEVFLPNGNVDTIYHVDLYSTEGITHFRYRNGTLALDENPHSDYMYVEGKGFNWSRLPLIPFKYNAKEIPLIRNVKRLQDALNEVMSDFQNNMQEDPRSTILVLKNYDGTNIPEFRQNLATYGVIKVTTVDGVQGGVETLNVEVNAANYQAILMQLKRAIVENGRGFDAKEERMDGDPNQMNIQSMYTDIDLDVNAMETEFQAGFEELKWFIDQYLIHTGNPDYTDEEVTFVFNRDIFINEDSMIANCVASVGIISNKTLLARHPWVTNLERELSQLEEDKAAEMEEMEQMTAFQNKNKPNNGGGGGSE
jgi:SPP1 family phage portal protein